jgi:hypothetical protein
MMLRHYPGCSVVTAGPSGQLERFVADAGSATTIAIAGYGSTMRGPAGHRAPAFWNDSSIFCWAGIAQSRILGHRRVERPAPGSSQLSSRVACGRAHIRTSPDLMR